MSFYHLSYMELAPKYFSSPTPSSKISLNSVHLSFDSSIPGSILILCHIDQFNLSGFFLLPILS